MAHLDLSNPVVLKNYMESQIKEGKGEVVTKNNVEVYRLNNGLEFVVPGQIVDKPTEVIAEEPTEAVVEKPTEVIAEEPKKNKYKNKNK